MGDGTDEMPREAGGVLPAARVLNYVTAANSPTRVRRVAAVGLLVAAGIYGVVALVVLGVIVVGVMTILRPASAGGAGAGIMGLVPYIFQRERGWLILFGVLGTCGATVWGCSGAVERGRKLACKVARAALIPMPMIMILLSAGSVVVGTVVALDDPGHRHYAGLLLWLLAPVFALGALLAGDLLNYLAWIAEHPITEKPAAEFLPRAGPRA